MMKKIECVIKTDIDLTRHVSVGFPDEINEVFSDELTGFYKRVDHYGSKARETLNICVERMEIKDRIACGIFHRGQSLINAIFRMYKFEGEQRHELTLMVFVE
jgi:hypothetical protein